jgi:beta-lactamase regulating signal transducer with metallopeptidase domain
MNALLDGRLVQMLPDAALRGTLLLAAALAATALMRRAPASQRHLVMLAALAGVLLLPIAAAVVPAWRVLPADASPAAVFRPRVDAAAPARTAAGMAPKPHRAEPAGSVIRTGGVLAAPVEASAAAPAAPVAVDAPAPRLRLRDVALLAWLAGVLILGVRLVVGVAAVWRMERRCVEMTDERWTGLTDRLSRRIGLGRIVRLLRADRSTVPMTWGAFRPVILLPPEAEGWDEGRRAAVLAHELAHVRRWDALTQWIAHLAVTLFWFNPLVWMAAHRLRQEREHACDDAVLAVGTRATEYADHLLTIVRSLGSAPGPAAALAMARPSQFEGRLLAILDGATPRRPVSRALAAATAVLALTCVVPLAALRAAEPARAGSRGMPIEERARTFGSAGEAAAFLLRLVRDPATPPMAMEEVARASRRITADGERVRVLNAVIDRDDVEATGLSLTLASAGEMRSQPLLTAFLRRVARERPVADGAVCDAFFAALERVRAPADVHAVLEGVLQQPELDVAVMEKVIRVGAARLDAAGLRTLLGTAALRKPVRGQALDAYTQAAARLRDPAARRAALEAVRIAAAAADTARCVVGCDARWGAQMEAGELEYEYHQDEPDSTYVRIDARNALLSWRDGASEVDLRPGGVVTLRERTAAGVESVVELREDGDGGVIRSYRVGGQARPWDAAAQRWYEAANQHLYRHIKR